MKKIILPIMIGAFPMMSYAQSAIDAMQLSQPDFKGTARFMSMGGAFTALGGDLSTLGQNPAGIGIYRSSDMGITLDINMQNTATDPGNISYSQTKVYCDNFGYVGVASLGGPMKTFAWGASYNRISSFDRVVKGYVPSTMTSLSNYIASYTNGIKASDLDFGDNYNPYIDSGKDWLSILAYSGYMINPTAADNSRYNGLFQGGTVGDAEFKIRERGYVDEYNIDFGGNVENIVYWGIGFGITDLSYTRETNYNESMANARIYNVSDGSTTTGDAGFDINNYKHISGSGWNFKAGVIIKPINELRLGFAIHTPTWYKLDHSYVADLNYSYYNPDLAEDRMNPFAGNEYTDDAYFNWKLYSPWRLMVGAAGVIGSQAIISVDYEYVAYNNMKEKKAVYDYYGYIDGYEDNSLVNDDINNYCQSSNILRVGAEYRVTPQFCLRAGYNIQTSGVKEDVRDGKQEVFTSGTDPGYSFDKTTQYVTCGLGYRYKSWYIDAAYVHKNRKSTYHAYTDFAGYEAPSASITDNNNSIVFSTGFRF